MENTAVKIFLKEFAEAGWGYDLEIIDEAATVGDYVAALDEFQAKTMADCRGCDGCCHERIPLTFADFFLARPLTAELCGKPPAEVTLTDWLEQAADLQFLGEALDLTLKRQTDGSCIFLNSKQKECSKHLWRTLVCRTHCCLPKSPRALDLRSAVINCGEDELCRRLLQTTAPSKWQHLLKNCNLDDYPPNGFAKLPGDKWKNVTLHTLVSPALWGKLFHPSTVNING